MAPFDIRAKTGESHYFITAKEIRESAKVTAFKTWMRDEIAADMQRLGFEGPAPAPIPARRRGSP